MRIKLLFVVLILFLGIYTGCENNSFAYNEKYLFNHKFDDPVELLKSLEQKIVFVDNKINNIKLKIDSIGEKITKYNSLYIKRN